DIPHLARSTIECEAALRSERFTDDVHHWQGWQGRGQEAGCGALGSGAVLRQDTEAGGQLTMLVLGLESSCDETSAAVLRNERDLLGHVILSQDVHKIYGGVVPEIASRAHLQVIDQVVDAA